MVNSCAVCGCCTRTDIVREHLEDTLRICDVSAKGLYIFRVVHFTGPPPPLDSFLPSPSEWVNVEIDFQILEEKPSSLPWLENKRLEEQAETETKEGPFKDAPAAVWKPYVSGNLISVIYTVIKSGLEVTADHRSML
jgi:hypothetical protein